MEQGQKSSEGRNLMILRSVQLAFTLVLFLSFPSVAEGGCLNLCDIASETTVVIEPPLTCADIKASADDCDCGVRLQITNNCDATLTFVDFRFPICAPEGAERSEPCAELHPGGWGRVLFELTTVGDTRQVVMVRDAEGVEHRIELATTVTSFDDGCACSLPGRSRSSGLGGAALLALLGFASRFRRVPRAGLRP